MDRKSIFPVLWAVLLCGSLIGCCCAAPVQWAGNSHWYQAVAVSDPYGISWDSASAQAAARGGYLATITSTEENEFVFGLVEEVGAGNSLYWSSGWLTDEVTDYMGPWLGGHKLEGTWQWVTGESWGYTNWGNNGGVQEPSGDGPYLQYYAVEDVRSSFWNDAPDYTPYYEGGQTNPPSYVIEWNETPPTVPSGPMVFSGCNPMLQPPGMFISDPNGEQVVRVLGTARPGEWKCMWGPDWSPSGTQVALTYECQLAVLDFCCTLPWPSDMLREPRIIRSCGTNPKWSPAGDRIAFISEDGVALINPDGSEYRVLLGDVTGMLSWSADGESVIVGGGSPPRGDLYRITDIDDPSPTVLQLTDSPDVAEIFPALSPTGSELAYSEGPAVEDWDWTVELPQSGIRVVDYPLMTTVRVVTDDPLYHDMTSSWSPDGQYIYFTRTDATSVPRRYQLWRVKADGSEPEEPVPGLTEWESVTCGPSFLRQGAYTSTSYALPSYTNVPVATGVVGVQDLAGFQADLQFGGCCGIVDTLDSCLPGAMVDHWSFATPIINQEEGWVRTLAYAADPGMDRVSGSGEILNLTASMSMYGIAPSDEGIMPFWHNNVLELSDDWGDPIELPTVIGGLVLKPLSSLAVSELPAQVWADSQEAAPFDLTITALGDFGEVLPWFGKEVELFVEMPDPEYGYATLYSDLVNPSSVTLTDGVWNGQAQVLGGVRSPARLLARYRDWGGRSNEFVTLLKGDVNGDDSVSIFDVIKIANIAIGRGTWEDWQWWAANLNGDEEVNIYDVIICADRALGEMGTTAAGRTALLPAGEVTVSTDLAWTESEALFTVYLSDCTGVAGAQVELEYDAKKLRYIGVAAGELLQGSSWSVLDNDLDGKVRAIAYTPTRTVLTGGQGSLLEFQFARIANGKGKVELTKVDLSTAAGLPIACTEGKTNHKP